MGDITDLFTDVAIGIGSAYLNRPPQQTMVGNFGPGMGYAPGGGFTLPTTPVFADEGVVGLPGGDFVRNPPTQCGGAAPVYKKVCGAYKWVFPKRRRRKQLLTNSDAAGLAKLKGLVGVGKTMDCWIATHS